MQAEIQEYLSSIQPDLQQLIRLFGLPDGLLNALWFDLWESETRFFCRFEHGERSTQDSVPVPARTGDERLDTLHRRRACRRLCRQTCYLLLRHETGLHPDWGSLTGIRPTRLFYELLEQGASAEAAERALVERFDLLPAKAELLRETVQTQLALPPTNDGWIDVYVGIPFCTTRCAYCSFSSGELGNGRLVAPYLEALSREMAAGAELLRRTGRKLRALYIGGGTPTALGEQDFAAFLDQVQRYFPDPPEWTVEAGRPDTITRGKLRAMRERGVGRISVNPQTMNDRTLSVIGRAHTAAQTVEAYSLAREEGLGHINMDVIAGLPGETLDDFAHTMACIRELRPESLTVHTLAIKRSSRLHLEHAPLPPEETAAAMTACGRDTARALGMTPYYLYRQKYMAGAQENVGYALPGHACLYNVDIMEEGTHILAFGANAISKRVFPDEGHIERAPNVSNIEQYIARVDEMIQRKERLFGER